MQALQYLDLSANQFYCPIPAQINDLYGLNHLNLSSNNFTGGFPNGTQNLQQLAILDLHSNLLWGDLGVLFSELRLGGGFFSDDAIILFRNLHVLDLSDNELNAKLPSFGSLLNLEVLRLSNAQLFGPIPVKLLQTFIPLKELDLSRNEILGKDLDLHL